ncbi:hypothetical protein Val02_72660 [Virgisporangium aliadipatigenens]|uniref:Uncharacterized protein n=1 Tax=Virgisporangium aliadipatigenens TaxID=741659 RepID=A0A8J4DTN3_9ACTN|nr:hypothetical protein [Virgisporangium aliadipatigenens]GIJ50380.1 hypothetical protein Val02_72660 [Virgisporangium aliadipatigenens]
MTGRAWDDAEAEHLTQVTALAERLVTAEDPYEAGLELWGHAGRTAGELAVGMQLIWGFLTDRVELKPEEGQQARAEMRRAAREWLALDLADRAAVEGYLDYWLHDVCGYDR